MSFDDNMRSQNTSRNSNSVMNDYDNEQKVDQISGVCVAKKAEKEFNSGGLLLNGDFNENESHEAFRQAVLEWRKGDQKIHKPKKGAMKKVHVLEVIKQGIDIGTDNTVNSSRKANEILEDIEKRLKETSNLSYAERLLLKKYRRSDVEDFFKIYTKETFNVLNENPVDRKIETQLKNEKSINNLPLENSGKFLLDGFCSNKKNFAFIKRRGKD
jgi:hypothetical protein